MKILRLFCLIVFWMSSFVCSVQADEAKPEDAKTVKLEGLMK
jgi:hypothetical protein